MDEENLAGELDIVLKTLKHRPAVCFPKCLPPMLLVKETSSLEKEKVESTDESGDKHSDAKKRLNASKAALAKIEAAVAQMEDETKKVDERVKELKLELAAKTLRKDGLDMDRKKLEDRLYHEMQALKGIKPSTSTSTPTLPQEPVGIRGLLDSRKLLDLPTPRLMTRTLEPMSLKSPPPLYTSNTTNTTTATATATISLKEKK